MTIKDLIITGICKLLRNATVNSLVTEAINEVSKSELDTLKGMNGNIQNQISSVNGDVSTAQTLQTAFKSGIATAVNNIPRNPNSRVLSSGSTLSEVVDNINAIEHGPDVSMVTATDDNLKAGLKFVDKDWTVVTGTLPDLGTNPSTNLVSKLGSNLHLSLPGESARNIVDSGVVTPLSNLGDVPADKVVKDYTFTSTAGVKVKGTVPKTSGYENATSVGYSGSVVYVRVPSGTYTVKSGGYGESHEVLVKRDDLFSAVGLAASDIRQGKTVLQLDGTYTSDGTVSAGDILDGKVAYSKGTKITGTMPNYAGTQRAIQWYRLANNRFEVAVDAGYYDCTWAGGSYEYLTYEQVRACIGLTSTDQLKQGVSLLGWTGTGTTGIDTSDANAAASQILKDKTAYVKGSKITGTIPNFPDLTKASYIGYTSINGYYDSSGSWVLCSGTKVIYFRQGRTGYVSSSNRDLIYPASEFGNATASDVASGKTFTSASGLRVTGTLESITDFMLSWVANHPDILSHWHYIEEDCETTSCVVINHLGEFLCWFNLNGTISTPTQVKISNLKVGSYVDEDGTVSGKAYIKCSCIYVDTIIPPITPHKGSDYNLISNGRYGSFVDLVSTSYNYRYLCYQFIMTWTYTPLTDNILLPYGISFDISAVFSDGQTRTNSCTSSGFIINNDLLTKLYYDRYN